ncbi:DUF2326 domain-containing protein [Ancylobacter sp. 3268]|uniref:DUF2326 domain-containing protein n=1 Tax=Ancylobacter sp. 3268 TaxID=2817752 RepID=UPI0038575E34
MSAYGSCIAARGSFVSVIADLYGDRTGEFVVGATENGLTFQINIQGDGGGGIAQVEIFCFDLALRMWAAARVPS